MEEQPSQTGLNATADELVRYLRDDTLEPVEASANGLVSLTMSAGYRVIRLKIDPAAAAAGNPEPLEQAMITAFSNAMQELSLRTAKHLQQFTRAHQRQNREPFEEHRLEEASMALGGGVGGIGTVHVATAADFIKRHYDWAREHQDTGPQVRVQARIGFLLTESRPAAFGAQVTEMGPVVALAIGDLFFSNFGQLSGDGERQTINASGAVIGTDRVHLVLNSSDGLGTLRVPHEEKVFDLNHCVLIGSRNKGILGEIAHLARGEVMTLMLWGKESVSGPN